jgi:transcription elongation GreA/GreB family factor
MGVVAHVRGHEMDVSQIRVGSLVRIRDRDGEAEFYLVPDEDADIAAERVSADSPISVVSVRDDGRA